MPRSVDHLNGNLPRLLTEQAAAAYCSMTLERFREAFSRKMSPFPGGGGEKLYDRFAIDRVIDEATGAKADVSAGILQNDILARMSAYSGDHR